jgi:hypothetical protein
MATLANAMVGHSVIYCLGITLSLYGKAGLERVFEMIDQFRANGGRFAFDTNFRFRGWPNRDAAKRAYHRAFDCADILLASTEDLDLLSECGDGTAVFPACRNPSERILKLGAGGHLRGATGALESAIEFLTGASAAAGLVAINSVGNLGSFVAQSIVPWIAKPMLFLAICLTIGGLMTFPVQSLIRRKRVSMVTRAPATT